MHYKRDQKYKNRTRYLYALRFAQGPVYVGQTVDLKARERQHRSPKGGWMGQPFTFEPLGSMVGTQAQAEDWEHAWRYVAARAGYVVWGLPPGIRVQPGRQMSPERHRIARGLRWPGAGTQGRVRQRKPWWLWLGLGVAVWALGKALGLL